MARPLTCLLLALLLFGAGVYAQTPAATGDSPSAIKDAAARGAAIIRHGAYPELRVDGVPFFVHSASFFYYRVPRDLWEKSLEQHRRLGINTIDIYIPWNWHEPREGQLDFDGHTNPRRDLRSLLRLITEKGFKLIARPGPVILNEWRHGGYPEWLLERPEYRMELRDRLEGRYAPLSNLNARDAEAAAKGWLENATHMAYARKWLAGVARELAPYGAKRSVRVTLPAGKKGEPEEKEVSGPLLFVQLDDDMATGRTNYAGPLFWRYMEELRQMLAAGGLDAPFYINPTDMRVAAAGFGLEQPIGAMGQWYLQSAPLPAQPQADAPPGERRITAQDVSTMEFFVETLKTQPAFPPMICEYQAAWYTPGDDVRPFESPAANTVLSSRLLIAHGAKGLNYFPAQDTLYPAGYETPWANRHYRWDAALSVNGSAQPRARAVRRNGQSLTLWAELLASSHKRADFGLVYPLGSYPQEQLTREDILGVSQTVMRIARIAQLAGLTSELLDPHYQPAEQLLRHALVLLPVSDPGEEKFQLSETAQRTLVEYVRRGGTLVYFPLRPSGRILEEIWKTWPAPKRDPASAISASWPFGSGRVLESSKDFYSWLALEESFADNRGQFEAAWAMQALREFMEQARARPAVRRAPGRTASPALLVTQLVSNAGTATLGARSDGRGLLSVANLDDEAPTEEILEILSPRAGARGRGADYITLPVSVPAREALLLPLHFPLCSAASATESCEDEIVAAGAELVRVEREGKTLELTFYTPTRARVILKLAEQPRRVAMDEMRPEAKWHVEKRQFEFELLRGAAPDLLRTVRISLRYTPRVPEKPDPRKQARRDYDYAVIDAVRLPLAEDTSLFTYPPLVVLNERYEGQLVVEAINHDEMARAIDIKVEGPVRGDSGASLDGRGVEHVEVKLKPARELVSTASKAPASSEGLLAGQLQVRSGRDQRSAPLAFVVVPAEGSVGYQFDFDRDGANEWALENSGLRVIVSPEAGGRAVALVEKSSKTNFTTSVGALRDHFAYTPNPPGSRPERARGRYGLFNRAYRAEWIQEEKNTALRLSYEAPDVHPAGARIEKTVRLADATTLEVDYRVRLEGPAVGEQPPAALEQQAFVAVSSVPVLIRGEDSTRFCWQAPAAAETLPGATPQTGTHCEMFVPGCGALEVPEGIGRVEVRTPGQLTLAVEWESAKLVIEMKDFSALLKLGFPALVPGGETGQYRLRYTIPSQE